MFGNLVDINDIIRNAGNWTETSVETETTYELETEERDAKELADRYAEFYKQLIKREVFHEHALSMTEKLIQAEQCWTLPEIED